MTRNAPDHRTIVLVLLPLILQAATPHAEHAYVRSRTRVKGTAWNVWANWVGGGVSLSVVVDVERYEPMTTMEQISDISKLSRWPDQEIQAMLTMSRPGHADDVQARPC